MGALESDCRTSEKMVGAVRSLGRQAQVATAQRRKRRRRESSSARRAGSRMSTHLGELVQAGLGVGRAIVPDAAMAVRGDRPSLQLLHSCGGGNQGGRGLAARWRACKLRSGRRCAVNGSMSANPPARGTHSSSSSMRAWLGGRGLPKGPPPPPLTTISCRAAPARRARAARPRIGENGVSAAGGANGGATGRAGGAPGARSKLGNALGAWVWPGRRAPAWRRMRGGATGASTVSCPMQISGAGQRLGIRVHLKHIQQQQHWPKRCPV